MVVIEALIIAYLTEHAGISYPVYGDMPPGDDPKRYYLVDKTGNSVSDHLHTAQITVQSVSSVSKGEAAEMNEAALKAMMGLVSLGEVSACRLNSDYDYTDTSTKRYRFQAVYDVTYYRED